jgi:hypothetical protein
MYEPLKTILLRVLRVPAEPEPPAGSPGSLKVFRAGRNYLRYKLALWSLRQVGALIGVLVILTVGAVLPAFPLPEKLARVLERGHLVERRVDPATGETLPAKVGDLPGWLGLIEGIGILILVGQAPIGYALVRIDYEMRWYLVTDRSLRIREGVWTVKELTMTFANIQNVNVEQGPIQRLLDLADVKVRSAGGGAGAAGPHGERERESLHEGYFRGVDNAGEIRDLMLTRLKQYRDAGLGDPEERAAAATVGRLGSVTGFDAALDAAGELLNEARALGRAVGG